MNRLFTLDIKNYSPSWQHSKRDSARGIIIFDKGASTSSSQVSSGTVRLPPYNLELPVLPEDTEIALVYAEKRGYYKFPGGGIKEGEDPIQALVREVTEETGLSVIPDTIKEYGSVNRYQKSNFVKETVFDQESFYYFCQVESGRQVQNLDDYEEKDGFTLKTTTLAEALRQNMTFRSEDIFETLMIMRDTSVLHMLMGRIPEPSAHAAEVLLAESVTLNPGPWELHSKQVAESARKVAAAVNENGGNMDSDKAYVYGLLHDVGRRCGFTYMAHVMDGYDYLHPMGFENAARICLTHSFNLQSTNDYIGKIDIPEDRYRQVQSLLEAEPFNDYDRLIQLLDSICAADGTKDLEARMSDVKRRYGSYPQPKWDKNFQLKSYFEQMTGKDLYQIIR